MQNKDFVSKNLVICSGLARGLTKVLYTLLESNSISDKDFNCILSLAEAIENNLEILNNELSLKL